MLTRISSNYAVNLDKVLSANIVSAHSKSNPNKCYIMVQVGSEEGEIKTDHVSFDTWKEAETALDKLTQK